MAAGLAFDDREGETWIEPGRGFVHFNANLQMKE